MSERNTLHLLADFTQAIALRPAHILRRVTTMKAAEEAQKEAGFQTATSIIVSKIGPYMNAQQRGKDALAQLGQKRFVGPIARRFQP